MRLKDLIKEDLIIEDIRSEDKEGVVDELLKPLLRELNLSNDGADIKKILLDREELGSTGVGNSIAIPHVKTKDIKGIFSVFGRSKKGIDFNSLDGKPVHLFFLLISGEELTSELLQALSQACKVLMNENVRKNLINARDKEELYSIIYEEGSKIG